MPVPIFTGLAKVVVGILFNARTLMIVVTNKLEALWEMRSNNKLDMTLANVYNSGRLLKCNLLGHNHNISHPLNYQSAKIATLLRNVTEISFILGYPQKNIGTWGKIASKLPDRATNVF
jgi:hypothetical protein